MYCTPAAFPAFKRIFKQARQQAFLSRQLPLFSADPETVGQGGLVPPPYNNRGTSLILRQNDEIDGGLV